MRKAEGRLAEKHIAGGLKKQGLMRGGGNRGMTEIFVKNGV